MKNHQERLQTQLRGFTLIELLVVGYNKYSLWYPVSGFCQGEGTGAENCLYE